MWDHNKVYRADPKDLAELELENLSGKWASNYPVVIGPLRGNSEKLTN